ncbi:SRPBCC family protein [Chondromyces crocatus]|uniref:Polyketide cyclase n=1 Tax=Chondromyces crocatus TaxID=52 RepID=A0A0K1EPL2_CHOCO|nr:SRPBCC family protein [Chondromyces crocatus]AKT42577.1 uncharacterized protein CMC5_068040 [Chondromyces crocatus]
MSEPPPASSPPVSRPPSQSIPRRMLRLWFGFSDPVARRPYLITGVSLMVLKYLLEAGLVFVVTGKSWSPLTYLNPIMSQRLAELRDAPTWMYVLLALNTLPFMWIGASMSVRRAVDAGMSAWFGLGFIVPILNLPTLLMLAALPSRPGAIWLLQSTPELGIPDDASGLPLPIDTGLKAALLGVAAAVAVGLSMTIISVHSFDLYGATLFFVTPLVMGVVSAFLYNRPHPRSLRSTMYTTLASTLIAGACLLLFALEGLLCLFMAFPIAACIAILGALIGRAVAVQTRTPFKHTAAMMLALPGIAGAEAQVTTVPLHEVQTAIEIDAPPEAVWPNVIGFSELPRPAEWVFRTGIAYPTRARIEGEGVGAVRHCEFTTGPFVEPITAWEPPRRLAFDVAAQPPAMKEWSPFQHVHPPHLDGSLRSRRGEFRLIPLPGGRTRLEGSTWYELSMAPTLYWKVWSDDVLHRIHHRVLQHVKRLSEESARAASSET